MLRGRSVHQYLFVFCRTDNYKMITVFLFALVAIFRQTNGEIVKIDQGLVNGTVLQSRNGTPYHAFYAIPYAAPPVGELRFKPPAAPPTWTGVRQAVAKGPVCMQNGYSAVKGTRGTEDCLYISVFTRNLNVTKAAPVMVYIHGGAYSAGSGDSQDVHPLMDRPVVVVTFNYRLGILGFFSAGDDIIPGNYAMKDQSAALKWVNKNIAHFGGDPNSVTIFGQSSGSVSVNLHLMSPLSKGFFHQAIMESGSARELWAYYNEHHCKKTYEDTIKRTNCTNSTTAETLNCLQQMPAQKLLQIEKDIKTEEHLVIKYRPVVESASLPGAFLTAEPHTSPYQDPSLPIIMGFNSAEGIMDTLPFLLTYPNMTSLNEKLEEILPQKLHYLYTTNLEKRRAITRLIRKFYLVDGAMTKGQEQNLCNIMSDGIFIMPIIEAAIQYPGPKYIYMYDYRHAISLPKMAMNITHEDLGLYGACHGDELMDLFYSNRTSPHLIELDLKFSKKIIAYWTNFVSSGNPNIGADVPKLWLPAHSRPLHYLYMYNGGFHMRSQPLEERFKFWSKCPLNHQYG